MPDLGRYLYQRVQPAPVGCDRRRDQGGDPINAVLRGLRSRLNDEAGFSLIELVAALSLLGFGFFALAGAASTGARLLVEGRQRQAATEIASREIEHLRNFSYDQVVLQDTPPTSSEPRDPDYHVSADQTQYDYTGNGDWEDLLIDATDGSIIHHETVIVGSTTLTVHRFITWVDDPNVTGTQDYKRVTIAVVYRAPIDTGSSRTITASALFTTGNIIVGGTSLGPSEGTDATPLPEESLPSTTCDGDSSPPSGSFSILSGTGASEGFTASETVTISLSPSDDCTPITARFSNDGIVFGDPVTYDPANPTATWTVPTGDGSKSVWTKYADANGNAQVFGPKSITLDQTSPTVPGTLTKSVSCSGDERTVTLSWGASSDTNLVGYRVYRSIDGGPFEVLLTTSSLSGSDTHKKTLDSVQYRVVAYDKAGNEGSPTNVVAVSKNQCS